MDEQKYCISARNKSTGYTEDITGPMSESKAIEWTHLGMKHLKKDHVYFRVSKYPFRRHKK